MTRALLAIPSLLLLLIAGGPGHAPEAHADVKEFSEVTGKLFDPKSVDPAIVRAGSLEIVLNQKASRIIEGAMVPADQYRVSVLVTMSKKPKPKPAADTKDKTPPEEQLNPGSLLSVDSLISRFEAGDPGAKKPLPAAAAGAEDEEFVYEVQSVQMQVTFSDKVSTAAQTELQATLKKEFTDAFGDKLKFQSKSAGDIIKEEPPKPETLWDSLSKLQFVVMALILGAMFIGSLLVFKLVPSRQGAMPFRIELNNAQQDALNAATGAGPRIDGRYGEEADPYGTDTDTHVRDVGVSSEDDAKLIVRQLKALEQQIAAFVRQNTAIAGVVLHEWAASDDFIKITLFLEALAKEGVNIDRTEFRPEVMDAIRASRGATTRLSLREREGALEEVYWGLVSNTFLGEDRTSGQFRFLETVNDEAIVELISGESEEAQVTVLLGLSERRAARVLSRLEPQRREALLRGIFAANPMEAEALAELAARLSDRVTEIKSSQPDVIRMSEGVESLVPILETMDFETQFATAQSFLYMQADLKSKIETRYFNVALLPDAKTGFLEGVFQERKPEWIHSLLAMFDTEFRDRAIAVLPALQQRMIRDLASSPVTPSAAWGALRELNDEILDRLANREITLPSIFNEEPLAIPTANAEGSETAEIPQAVDTGEENAA